MIISLLIMFVLLVISAALLFIPWSDKRDINRDVLNRLIYRQRLQELDGNSDAVDRQQREQLVTDLQKNLLDDVPVSKKVSNSRAGNWIYLPGVFILSAITLGVFFKTNGVERVYEWQQVVAQTPTLLDRVMNPGTRSLTMEDMSRLALGLRTRLQEHPQNLQSWVMLGRLGIVLNNYTLASQAFEKAYLMAPDNIDVKTGYAEVLLRSQDPADNRLAGVLLDELLKADHTNIQVLGLIAFNAFEHQQYQEAIGAWEMILRLLPADDSRRAVIERSITQAKTEQMSSSK